MADERPAGFWVRALALVVDVALLVLVQVSLGAIAGALIGPAVEDSLAFVPAVWMFTLIFAGLYTSALHAMGGQTVGKMVARVRVVGLDGEWPAFGPALLRYFGYFVSLGTFTLGYVMAGLRGDKRALHDLIAGTRVERLARPVPPPPAEPPEDSTRAPESIPPAPRTEGENVA